jgi:phosphoadenosine phosphosulfate reductase
MSSPLFANVDSYKQPTLREESGYASAESSQESLPEVYFAKPHLKFINAQLQKLEPQGTWKWFVLGKLMN